MLLMLLSVVTLISWRHGVMLSRPAAMSLIMYSRVILLLLLRMMMLLIWRHLDALAECTASSFCRSTLMSVCPLDKAYFDLILGAVSLYH